MANIIQIKSGSKAPGKGVLYENELGYDMTNGFLYIGVKDKTKEPKGIKVAYATKAGSADSATSAKTAESATTAAGLSNTLPITKGGTGATDAASARSKLGFTLANLGINASATELNYVKGVTSGIQTQINSNKTAASNAQSTANTAQASANTAQYTADNALAKAGGDMTGYINFNNTSMGLSWKTSDGTIMNLRPYSPNDVFQLTMQNPSKGISEYGVINIYSNGQIQFGNPSQVRENIGALSTSGGTITGVLKHEGNHYVHKTSNSSENSYFMKFATIKITGTYLNQEIHFKLIHRGDRITNVYVCYNNGNTTTPSLNYIQTDCINVWIHNEGGGVWGLYANAWGWDSVEVLDFTTGKYASDKMTVTWLSTTTSSLPSGAISASTRPLPSRYYGDTLPSSAPAGAIFFKKV